MAAFFVFFLIFSILGILCFPICVYYLYNYGLFMSMTLVPTKKLKYFLYYVVVFYTLVAIYFFIENLYLVFR